MIFLFSAQCDVKYTVFINPHCLLEQFYSRYLFLSLFMLLILVVFTSLLYLSRCLWRKNYLPISWCIPYRLLVHCFRKYEIHTKRKVSLKLKCVSHGRQAAQRLYQCYYSHWQIWRKKKKRIRSGQLESAHHSPLTYIQLDMTETVIAELSQSVHHFTQQ